MKFLKVVSSILSVSLKINNIKGLSVFILFIKTLNSVMKELPNFRIIDFLFSELLIMSKISLIIFLLFPSHNSGYLYPFHFTYGLK